MPSHVRDWLGFCREEGICGMNLAGLSFQKVEGSITVMSITSGCDGSATAWTVCSFQAGCEETHCHLAHPHHLPSQL